VKHKNPLIFFLFLFRIVPMLSVLIGNVEGAIITDDIQDISKSRICRLVEDAIYRKN